MRLPYDTKGKDLMEQEELEGSGMETGKFELNTDILEEQSGTFMTFGDLYGYYVFSEEFQNNMENYQKKKKDEQDIYFQNVLSGVRDNGTEAAFQAVFSANTQEVLRADYGQEKTAANGLGFTIGFILMGMFLTGGFLFLIDKKRKGRSAHVTDDNSDWTKFEKI